MRFHRTLARSVLGEVLLFGGLGLVGVGAILVTQNLLRELGDVAGVGFTAADGLAILASVSVWIAAYALPMAFLFGVLVTVGRMSADGEISALRGLGVSLGQFAAPVIALGVVIGGATGLLLGEAEPAARDKLRAVVTDVAARGGMIEPGRFRRLDGAGRRLILVEDRDAENRLTGVFLSDQTDAESPFTVVAERGQFHFDRADSTAHITLEQGDIHFEPKPADVEGGLYRRIAFGRFEYAWDLSELIEARTDRKPAQMDMQELNQVLDHFDAEGKAPPWARPSPRNRYEIEWHRRIALSFAPVLFALVGVPLGLRRGRGARSWGLLVCVVLVFAYYSLLQGGEFLAKDELVSASVGLWLPNLLFAASAGLLLLRARRAEF